MDTRKLFYEDCHLTRFSARVLSCEKTEKGFGVVLDQTAFYPEGGGQPCDLGTLNGIPVLDVQEKETEIVHFCREALEVGSLVEGAVDWQRRFPLMQQHTGEHIVSGIINRRFGWHNVGFHMGSEIVTIDFDGPVPQEALAEIEEEANCRVWENLPVRCWYPSPEELPNVGYRTKKQLPWPVRIVEIPGTDKCACCGVHVALTGEVGLIKLLSCVKFHQGVRIEMACGKNALALLTRVYEQNRQVSQAFSAKLLETGEAARKMNEALTKEKYRVTELQRKVFAQTAGVYAGKPMAVHYEPELTPALIRELAEKIAEVCDGPAVVYSGSDGRLDLCIARPGGDVKALGDRLKAELGARGGGKAGFFQGSVLCEVARLQEILEQV